MAEPIVKIFFKYYAGVPDNKEYLVQTIPLTDTPVITQPKVKNEIGKSGSFEFGLEPMSPFYNLMLQMRTLVRVTYFGKTIFHGRVLTISRTINGTRSVHCEGDFSFLLDRVQIGTKEELRPIIDVPTYLNQIIEYHNTGVEPEKKFVLGEVPGRYSDWVPEEQRVKIPDEKAKQQFGDNSWNSTMDRIENLLSDFGGYFRTRYDENADIIYLDWFDKYYNASLNTQTIEVTKNLLSLSGTTELDNLFTVVIPVGKNSSDDVYINNYWPVISPGHEKVNHILVSEMATLSLIPDTDFPEYPRKQDFEEAINRFGFIWKVVDFQNANTPEKLFAYAKDWIKNNYMPELTQWDVSALDLKILDSNNQALYCGDKVKLIHPEIQDSALSVCIISAEYDLYDPDKNKYTIGFPNQEINASYGVKQKTSTGSKTSSPKKATSPRKPPPEEKDEDEERIEQIKDDLLEQYIRKTEYGQDIGLDDPLAFLAYNPDGSEKTKEEASASVGRFLAITSRMSRDEIYGATQAAQALSKKTGKKYKWNDPEVIMFMENIPESAQFRQEQAQWKSDITQTLLFDYGYKPEEAEALLNESTSTSWLASLVDDDGKWTPAAADILRRSGANSAKIHEQAVSARNLIQGKKHTSLFDTLTSSVQDFTGGSFNFGDYLNFDLSSLNFNVGDIFNTNGMSYTADGLIEKTATILNGLFDGGATINPDTGEIEGLEFDLNSDTIDIDGTNGKETGAGGSIGLGTGGEFGGRTITLNRPYTYVWVNDEGKTKVSTVKAGTIAVQDMHFSKQYDSFRSHFGLIDEMYTDYLEVCGTFKAKFADINTILATKITADYVSTTRISSLLSQADIVSVKSLSCSGSMGSSGDLSTGGNFYINGHQVLVTNVRITGSGKTLTIYRPDGTYETFSKGDTEAAYIAGWNACVDAAIAAGAVYTRSAIYNDKVVGGNNYAHYYYDKGSLVNIDVGWYLTSYAPRGKNPTVPAEYKS